MIGVFGGFLLWSAGALKDGGGPLGAFVVALLPLLFNAIKEHLEEEPATALPIDDYRRSGKRVSAWEWLKLVAIGQFGGWSSPFGPGRTESQRQAPALVTQPEIGSLFARFSTPRPH